MPSRPSSLDRSNQPHAPSGVMYLSRSEGSDGPLLLQALASAASGAGIALLAPIAVLLIGIPIALAVRGLLEVVFWLSPAMR